MTETTIVAIVAALLAAIPPTLVALAGLIQSQRNAVKTDENTALTRRTSDKADDIIVKAQEIHTLTNSNLSKVTAQLEVALARLDGMQKLVSQMAEDKRVADGLARTHAEIRVSPAAGPAAPAPPSGQIAAALLIAADKAGGAILTAADKTDAALLTAAEKTEAALVTAAVHTDAILSSIDVNTASTAAHTEPPVPTVKVAE